MYIAYLYLSPLYSLEKFVLYRKTLLHRLISFSTRLATISRFSVVSQRRTHPPKSNPMVSLIHCLNFSHVPSKSLSTHSSPQATRSVVTSLERSAHRVSRTEQLRNGVFGRPWTKLGQTLLRVIILTLPPHDCLFVSMRGGATRPLACHPIVGLFPVETPLSLDFGGGNLTFLRHPNSDYSGQASSTRPTHPE